MTAAPSALLIGLGGAGCAAARRLADNVASAAGDMRLLLLDTDETTGAAGGPFTLIGAERLSGRGAGGDITSARCAFEDSLPTLTEVFDGVRLAVIITSLGGGTGSGGAIELIRRLETLGIASVIFATLPFAFEGPFRQRNARSVTAILESEANASFLLPMDRLVAGEDNLNAALARGCNALADGATLLWRLLATPGYIRLDAERLRRIVGRLGRGRFAHVTCTGPDRAAEAVKQLLASKLLGLGGGAEPVRAILCGILAGDDLRLSEVAAVADGLRTAFGEQAEFNLATVNDEATFAGQLAVTVLLFTGMRTDEDTLDGRRRSRNSILSPSVTTGRGLFKNTEPTTWHDQDLDTPTYFRHNLQLDT